MTRRVLKLGVVGLFVAVIALPTQVLSAAAPSKPNYDPSKCKTEAHGKLYIALDHYVLAMPISGAILVGDIYPEMGIRRLEAPNPAEPEGCPGNPWQLESYEFDYSSGSLSEKSGNQNSNTRFGPIGVTLIAQPAEASHHSSGELQQTIADSVCNNATRHDTLINGLAACRVKPDKDVRVEDWAASFAAPPNVYSAPLHERFVVNCGPRLFTEPISHCDVSYAVNAGFVVSYRFQPYIGPSAIPLEHIIQFDKSLRAQIEAALVKDYRWPNAAGKP